MKIGVFGGTFDPVHAGHLLLAERAREQLGLDRVLWVPAGTPWRKGDRKVSDAGHRLAMVKLAVEGNDAFEVSTADVERRGPTYSVDTVSELHKGHPGADMFLILGRDALLDLPSWRQPERLVELAVLAVAARAGERLTPAEANDAVSGLAERLIWVEMPRIDVSATELRRRAAAGRSLRYVVPDAVEKYIREHNLYKVGQTGVAAMVF